jgi:hypothetical protein
MRGVEGRPGQPAYQQFNAGLPGNEESTERGVAGSARQVVTDLVQRQRLNIGDIREYYDSWVSLQSESAGYIPQPMERTIRNVSLGLGFLFYNRWSETDRPGRRMQVAFQKRLRRWHEEYKGQLVLTHEEGLMLRDAAAVVNIPYDPGEPEDTQENVKKRTFVFANLGDRSPSTTTVVDADR